MKKYLLLPTLVVLTLSFVGKTTSLTRSFNKKEIVSIKGVDNFVNNLEYSKATQPEKKPHIKISKENEELKWIVTKFEGMTFDYSKDYYGINFLVDIIQLSEDFRPLYSKYLEEFELYKAQMNKLDQFMAKGKKAEPITQVIDDKGVSVVSEKRSLERRPGPIEPKAKSEKIIEDRVATKVAATSKNDDLIFFDYSSKKKPSAKVAVKSKNTKEERINDPLLAMVEKVQKERTKKRKKKETRKARINATVKVMAQEFSFNKGIGQKTKNFELRMGYTDNERYEDLEGQVTIQKSINNKEAILKATLLSSKYIDVSFDLMMERGKEAELTIPVLKRSEFNSFLLDNNYNSTGGFLLVELDGKTDRVEIDAPYTEEFRLDNKLKIVEDEGDYSYILFAGVEPGNTEISFVKGRNKRVNKLALIEEETVYYEPNIFLRNNDGSISLFEKSLLSQNESPLNIDGEKIKSLVNDKESKKMAMNEYDIYSDHYSYGQRKYLEFRHMNMPFFYGKNNSHKVVLPNENYMATMIKNLNLESLSGVCLVEYDFKNRPTEFLYIGKSGDDYLNLDQIFLNEDGSLTNMISQQTVKAFLLGSKSGNISSQVIYADGSEDIINSPCSKNNLVIEAL